MSHARILFPSLSPFPFLSERQINSFTIENDNPSGRALLHSPTQEKPRQSARKPWVLTDTQCCAAPSLGLLPFPYAISPCHGASSINRFAALLSVASTALVPERDWRASCCACRPLCLGNIMGSLFPDRFHSPQNAQSSLMKTSCVDAEASGQSEEMMSP